MPAVRLALLESCVVDQADDDHGSSVSNARRSLALNRYA